MINQKLTDSINNLSDQYIEEALDTTLRTTPASNTVIQAKIHPIPRKLITAAAMLCIGIGIGYAALNVLPNTPPKSGHISKNPASTPDKKSSIFSLLAVTAYAAERSDNSPEEGILLKENVPTVLSQYSPVMSSVPAMPFSFSYQKESTDGEIHFVVSADHLGTLQKYQQPGGIWELTEEGASLECKPDEKIYWQPSNDFHSASENKQNQNQQDTEEETKGGFSLGVGMEAENPDSTDNPEVLHPSDKEWINSDTLGADSIITVEVYAGKTLLETQYIGISYQDFQYMATLKLSVSTEQRNEGDFTIISNLYGTTDEEVSKKALEPLSRPSEQPGQVSGGGQPGQPSNGSNDE